MRKKIRNPHLRRLEVYRDYLVMGDVGLLCECAKGIKELCDIYINNHDPLSLIHI